MEASEAGLIGTTPRGGLESDDDEVSPSDELQKKRRRLLLYEEGERYKAGDLVTLNNFCNSNSASLKDLQLLAEGHDVAVLKRASRRLWAGRSDLLHNYHPGEDQDFIDLRDKRSSCACDEGLLKRHIIVPIIRLSGSCCVDTRRTTAERIDCLRVSHAKMRIKLKHDATAREQGRVERGTQGAGDVQVGRASMRRREREALQRENAPEPDPVLDAIENQRAILAAKVYDNLSMLVTCASCGGEHGKGAMIPLLNAKHWCVLHTLLGGEKEESGTLRGRREERKQ